MSSRDQLVSEKARSAETLSFSHTHAHGQPSSMVEQKERKKPKEQGHPGEAGSKTARGPDTRLIPSHLI